MGVLEGYPGAEFPTITAAQARALDQYCAEHAFVGVEQLMEVAGFQTARFVAAEFPGKTVVVLAGPGGNGGDALVAARHLANWGVPVFVIASRPEAELTGLTAHHLRAVKAAKIRVVASPNAIPDDTDAVIVDGLLGFGANRAPHGVKLELIEWANASGHPCVAIDVPSGLDADSGEAPGVVINATVTLALSAPKAGLAVASTAGEVAIVDIGVPRAAWARLRVKIGTPFEAGPIVRWDR